MTVERLIQALDLPEVVQTKMLALHAINSNQYHLEIEGLQAIATAGSTHERLQKQLNDPTGMTMLYIYLRAVIENKPQYDKLNITEDIYIETYKALSRFIKEYYQDTNQYVFERDWWAYRQVSMQIFRIGELEYEMTQVESKPILSIHIPSDAKLSKRQIESSLRAARTFFNERFPDYEQADMQSHTWLLSPALKGLLAPSSNILNFQSFFKIEKVITSDTSFLHWVFHTNNPDIELLEERTSLQRHIKAHLKTGHTIGAAIGFVDFSIL